MGRRKHAKGAGNQAPKKDAAKPSTEYGRVTDVGPRYNKYDQFTTRKRLLTNFCVDMTLLSLFGFLTIVCLSFLHSDEYKYIVSLMFGNETSDNAQAQGA